MEDLQSTQYMNECDGSLDELEMFIPKISNKLLSTSSFFSNTLIRLLLVRKVGNYA